MKRAVMCAIFAAFVLGLVLGECVRQRSDGVFYTVCAGQTCEIRAHLTDPFVPDPIIWTGPLLSQHGKLHQVSAPELAYGLNRLPGYGPYAAKE